MSNQIPPRDTRIDRIIKLRERGEIQLSLMMAKELQQSLLNTQVAEKARWVKAFVKDTSTMVTEDTVEADSNGLNWKAVAERCYELAPKVLSRQANQPDIRRKRNLANKVGREFDIPLKTGDPDRSRLFAIAASAIEDAELDLES